MIGTIWTFIAGDSRRGPAAVALAVVMAALLLRFTALPGPAVGALFAAIIVGGLTISIFERER